MRCDYTLEGALTNCQVVSASSADFGPAILKLAPLFKVQPAVIGGKPTAGQLTIPIHWCVSSC